MTQHRYFDYGIEASASVFKAMLAGLTSKTILRGGEIGVASAVPPTQPDRITIQPFWVMLDSPRTTQQGTQRASLLLHEDEPKQLRVPITSAAANYTVVLRHTDVDLEGGNAAVLTLDFGLLRNQNLTDGLVLGYVLYPGGGGGLTDLMLIQMPRDRIEGLSSPADGVFSVPPFSSVLYRHMGGPLPLRATIDDAQFRHCEQFDNRLNTSASIDQLRWCFVCGPQPPRTLTFDYVHDTGQEITIDLEDTLGRVSSSRWGGGATVLSYMLTQDFASDHTLETIAGQQLRRRRLRITNGTFEPGKRFRMQANITTAAGRRTLITGAGHSTWNQPFAG